MRWQFASGDRPPGDQGQPRESVAVSPGPLFLSLPRSEWLSGAPDALTGKQFDFQFTQEHSAQAAAQASPDYRYVCLPDGADRTIVELLETCR